MTGVSFEITGKEEALAQLGAAAGRLDDPTGLYDAIGAALVVSTQDRFSLETGPDGAKWAASARAKAEGGKTLTDTSRLVQSITHEATRTGVSVGTNVIYAAIHQLGGVIKAKNGKYLRFKGSDGWAKVTQVTMPARPFLGIDADDEADITDIASTWIMQPLTGTGGVNAGR